MDFVITIDDPAHLAGISWAREQHNATLPQSPEEGAPPVEPPLETDADYVQWVMAQAAASYADQQYIDEARAAAEAGRRA